MKIERFEDLQAWKEGRALVSEIYRVVRLSDSLNRDRRFRDQITAAAVSVMSNVAEGFARRSDREFTQYLFIAKGSCAEVQSLLYVALDQEYISQTEFAALYDRTETAAKLISGLITYLLAAAEREKRRGIKLSPSMTQRGSEQRAAQASLLDPTRGKSSVDLTE